LHELHSPQASTQIDTPGWTLPEEIAFLADGLKAIRNVVQPGPAAYLPDPSIVSAKTSHWEYNKIRIIR